MEHHEENGRQIAVWMAAAMTAPLAHVSGAGWVPVAVAALAVLPLTQIPGNGWRQLGRTASAAEFVWLAVVNGILLKNSGGYWPSSGNERIVPLVLLALAALTRVLSAPGVGTVIGLSMSILFAPVLLAGTSGVEAKWLMPSWDGTWNGLLPVIFLIPALNGIWVDGRKAKGIGILRLAGIGVGFALLTQGILSAPVARSLPDAFRQVSRSIGFAAVSRMEPVAAAAMTLGWYALTLLLLASAAKIAEGFGLRARTAAVAASVISALQILLDTQISGVIMVILCGILWVLVPKCCEKYEFKNK